MWRDPRITNESTMASFNLERFAKNLIAQSLFCATDVGVWSSVGLIDPVRHRERYVATMEPSEETYLIEEAIEWEPWTDTPENDAIGYKLASDFGEHGIYDSEEEVAEVLLALARAEGLEPAIMLVYDFPDME